MDLTIAKQAQTHIQRIYRHPALYDHLFTWSLARGRRAALSLLPERRPLRVLEVGVGSGLSFPYYPAGIELLGIDPSLEMLSRAAERIPTSAAQITLRRMDGAALELPGASFDAVVLLYVLSVAPDPEQLLREAHRVLCPRGLLLIANHFQGDLPLLRHFTPLTRYLGYHTMLTLQLVTGTTGWLLRHSQRIGTMRVVVMERE
jgi:phosphatidylethanolamine/phosphatidyl-N-methylethanolamine N-methyltransferase